MDEKVRIEFKSSPAQKFMMYAQAHHDGDVNAAMEDLLFCHKVLTAKMMRTERDGKSEEK